MAEAVKDRDEEAVAPGSPPPGEGDASPPPRAEVPAHMLDVADEPGAKLTAALAAAQVEFPPIEKGKTAEVKHKETRALLYTYKYADLGDVLAAVRPVLGRYGLALTQHTHHADGGKVILTTKLKHVGGGVEESTVELGQQPGNPQAFGGALTYLRRYEVVTLLGIAAEEDTDAQHVEPERRNGNGAERLPGWAQPATDRRKREFLQALAPIIGEDRAKAIAVATVDTFSVFPDLMVGFAKGLATHYVAVQAAGGAAAEAAAAREAAAASAAAEAPDVPASTDATAEAEAPEPSPPTSDATPQPGEPVEEPPPGTGEPPPPGPKPGSVPHPGGKLKGSREVKEAQLRALGCICTHPIKREGDNDQCPLEGHGIPF